MSQAESHPQDGPATAEGWKLLRKVLREQRRGLLQGVVIGLMWSAGKVSIPQLFKLGVDRGIEQSGSLLFWAGAITCAGIIAGFFAGWRRWIGFRESRWTESSLRERLFTHLQGLHIGYHDMTQTGQLMSRASSDLGQIQGFVVMIPITISNVAMVLAVMVIMLSSQPMLAIIALAPLPFINLAARRFLTTFIRQFLRYKQNKQNSPTLLKKVCRVFAL